MRQKNRYNFWINKKQHLATVKEVNIIFLQTINNLPMVFFVFVGALNSIMLQMKGTSRGEEN